MNEAFFRSNCSRTIDDVVNDLFTNVEGSRLVILVNKKIEGKETREKKKKNRRFLYASVNMTVNCVEKKKQMKRKKYIL